MSGIVGIVNFDGAPIDRYLLGRMTDSMAFRGPDAQEIWVDGNVGFGHALLRTTDESEHERQPFTLDGRVWIVADARVDARSELIPHIQAKGHRDLGLEATDVELILRAYQVWGEDCVEHLLGDFAFAIWDGLHKRLFCARDHLGVKPFFYAYIHGTLIFSNTLDCVRQHPVVSDTLNDLAIADFLLFRVNLEPTTTSFADVQRLQIAHRATWSARGFEASRYWTLPVDEPIYFPKPEDYVNRFTELLDRAVADRLRTKKIGVFMSGGVDSPTLAATACKILRSRALDCEVRAFTTVLDGIDGNERYYAGLVADCLEIPVHFQDLIQRMIDPNGRTIRTPEPVTYLLKLVSDREEYLAASGYSRVWFYGEGPDNALEHEWQPYLSYLIRLRRCGRLAKSLCELAMRSRRIPFLPRLLHPLKAWWRGESERPDFPDWLAPDFASRFHLQERWEENERSAVHCTHPVRPHAYGSFEQPVWEETFRQFDGELTAAPLEVRHPFVDLRVLRYMLSVPVVPWCRDKYLLRRAMRGILPISVLRRPKTSLRSDPQVEAAHRLGLAPLSPVASLARYIDTPLRWHNEASADMIAFQPDLLPGL